MNLLERAKKCGIDVEQFKGEDGQLDEAKLLLAVEAAEKEAADSGKDIDFWKEEAKKAFDARDKAKKDVASLKSKITEFESKIKDMPDSDTLTNMKKELDLLKEAKETADKEKEAVEMSKLDKIKQQEMLFEKDKVKLTQSFEAKLADMNKKVDSIISESTAKDGKIKELQGYHLENEILQAASKFGAFNPKQIVKLHKADFKWDEDLGRFIQEVRDEKGHLVDTLAVEDTIKSFLEDPENENLVESDTTRKKGKPSTSGNEKPVKSHNQTPPTKEELQEAEYMRLVDPKTGEVDVAAFREIQGYKAAKKGGTKT